ncbi:MULTISPECIES: hypothetical protein [Paenibacillus]|uniref:hypothetical protein n=1 Tax=Paenibacillus TaxID=44249 RepID=UPI00203AF192|nr:hypothetical protein [Paenibacillus camelliae]
MMGKRSTKKKWLWLVIVLILLVAFASILTYKSLEKEHDMLPPERVALLRLEYPAYNSFPELVEVMPSSFLELAQEAESIVIVKVIKQLPQYEINLISHRPSFVQYEVAVEKVISGKPTEDIIHLSHNAMFIGFEPELKNGMRFILATGAGKDAHEGKYYFSRYGTYYIVDDYYVLSTVDDEYAEVMNGKTLRSLIKEIHKVRK